MKSKPGPIYLACILLLSGLFLFVRCKTAEKTGKDEVNQFLNGFNNRVKEGNTDSLMAYFDGDKRQKVLKRLVNLLSGKKSLNGKEKPLAGISLDVDAAKIKIIDDEWATVSIPAKFSHEQLDSKASVLILKIHKVAPHTLKIAQVDARQFLTDYVAYANFIQNKTSSEKDLFSPITLAAFKTAGQLKARYDSVIWFEHMDNKTFYFVVKGRWSAAKLDSLTDRYDPGYKMGLLNPELKEIIPVEYDLIHNIGGTITGLIEVEKNQKKGLFDTNGKIIIPANYNEILPLNDEQNLAALRKGDDYFYLRKDYTVTERIADFKISDILNKIKDYGNSYTITDNHPENILEYNDRELSNSIVIPPSYLVEWDILPSLIDLRNPIRKTIAYDDMENGSASYKINFDSRQEQSNWLEAGYYSIINDYLGSRAGLYQSNAVLVIDKKANRIFGHQVNIFYAMAEGGVVLSGNCKNNHIMPLSDSLFEYETTAFLATDVGGNEHIGEAPYYFYLKLKNGKLQALPNERFFGFTKYVRMNESYLNGCYTVNDKSFDHMTPEMMQYAKNEIFAQYHYKFKNSKWTNLFEYRFNRDGATLYENVDDSLTNVDKYNIDFLNKKIKVQKPNTLAAK
ncbi:WG repeat-containing protein [uncultured Mucilaginibacter sp.]|uniref:WG repeat-containing protein n=1 Tax=uncultured Mucilaginibacter sp. TaxID=797541 RepID=UPI0025D09C04|nr:WG repeat-containing protein [uncultured Mucilaginibacter sp.]